MMRPPHPRLFLETIEVRVTRDVVRDEAGGAWASFRIRPPGKGWRVDRDFERRTRWIRRLAVPRRFARRRQ